MKTSLRKALIGAFSFAVALVASQTSQGQVTLPSTSPYSENFNTAPGASGTAYPAGWSSYDGTTVDNTMLVGNSASVSGGNYNFASRIGILGSGSSFSPGSIVLRLANTTGKTGLKISYDVVKIREQARSNSFNLEISTTSATAGFTPVTGGTYASGTIAEGTSTAYNNVSLAGIDNTSSNVWIRWSYTEISGSGSRDGIALDNVSLSWGAGTPVVTTVAANAITASSATIRGTVNANGQTVAASFNWGTTVSYGNSIAATPASVTGSSATNISATLASLLPNTQYQYRAAGTVGTTPTNGANAAFYTLANVPGILTVGNPTITTLDVTLTATTQNSNPATTTFAIRENGGSYIQADGSLGISPVWRTAAQWATVTVTGLDDDTTYTFSVKARNSAAVPVETAFGSAASGMTLLNTNPTLTGTSLTAFGNVCINTSSTANSFTIDGINLTTDELTVGPLAGYAFSTIAAGVYTDSLTIMPSAGTFSQIVYVQFGPTAATNYDGNIPVSGAGAPTISVSASGTGINTLSTTTTATATGLTASTAEVSGAVTAQGCSAITERGIVYSTVANPAIGGTGVLQLTDTTPGTGSFSVALSGLTGGTIYHTKAYSINGGGISYGAELTFTTTDVLAPVATPATAITHNSFTANWDASEGAAAYRLDVSESATFGNSAPATDLFFSEYVEGSSTNKYLEIFNGTGTSADLSDYRVKLYSNGSNTATGTSNDVQLSGTLASGSTIVLKSNTATIYTGAATVVASVNFNGNDAIALYKISTASNVDIIGRIGEDPGTAWTGTTNSTLDKTLVRKATVTSGVAINPASGFPTLETEWDVLAQNNVTNLGTHAFSGVSPSFVAGYENLLVAGTSQAVTGLTPSTNYYYRVRAVAGNTSTNSNTITVSTIINTEPTLTVTPLAGFDSVCMDTVSASNPMTISGINLTNEDVTVGPAEGFSFSDSETGTYSSTLVLPQVGGTFSQTVFVRFEPTDAIAYESTVAIAGGGATSIATTATGEGLNTTPTVTASAGSPSATVVEVTAEVTAQGCSGLTERGFVYGTLSNPEIDGAGTEQIIDSATTTGTFGAEISGLQAETTYYLRAYAINNGGTSYSDEIAFTTAHVAAPLATAATSIGTDRFTANWNASEGALSYRLDVSESATFGTSVAAADLFFSEYTEGSASNKYLEIYNGTGAAVNLSDYRVKLYSNGSSTAIGTANDVQLTGMLANGSTLVLKNSAATVYTGTATIAASVNFNGDDAIALYKISTASNVDIFGRIGEDPGTAWTATGTSTLDKTLVRKSSVTGGVTVNPAAGFPTLATEWEVLAQNDVTNLGAHAFAASIPSFVPGYEDLTVEDYLQEVTGLNPGTTYYYRVRAVAVTASVNSNIISVTTDGTAAKTALKTNGFGKTATDVVAYKKDNALTINSTGSEIRSVMVYDLTGKLLFASDKYHDKQITVSDLHLSNQIIIVKVGTLSNGTVTSKVAF